MKGLLAAAMLSYVHPAHPVAAAQACPKTAPVVVGGTQGYSDSIGAALCFTSITPTATPGLVYRSFAFFGDGLMLVFSSYGDGENNPNLTSAREFFFFPRRGPPRLTMDAKAGAVSVRMSDGGRADIDPADAQLSGFERGTAAVSRKIDPAERGGVEIPSYAGLLLDAGFRVGESPSGRPDASSTFRSAEGQLCAVKNGELFDYAPNGDHSFKFTDARLSAWLATRCPGLRVGF